MVINEDPISIMLCFFSRNHTPKKKDRQIILPHFYTSLVGIHVSFFLGIPIMVLILAYQMAFWAPSLSLSLSPFHSDSVMDATKQSKRVGWNSFNICIYIPSITGHLNNWEGGTKPDKT